MTKPNEPSVVANATVSPPEVRGLFRASLNWTVMLDVDAPSAVIETGAAEIREVVGSAACGVGVKVGVGVLVGAGVDDGVGELEGVGETVGEGDAVGVGVAVGLFDIAGTAAPEKL